MSLFSDTSHLFVRSLKKLLRNPILLFFSLFQPIIFLLFFTQLFKNFASVPGFAQAAGTTSYLNFAIAGIVLQNGFSAAFQSGTPADEDCKPGSLTKIPA